MQRSGHYEEYEKDEEDDIEIFPYQTLLIHAFVYDNPEIFQILLVNHIDNGINFIQPATKIHSPGNGEIMNKMLNDYYMSIDTALTDKQIKKKTNALRRLQRRNPETGKVPRGGEIFSTEEWNAEKGISDNITSLF